MLDRECKWFKSEFAKQYTLTLMEGVTDVHTLPTSERLSSYYHNLYIKGQSFVAKGDADSWTLLVGIGKSIIWKMGKDSIVYPYGSFEFTKDGKQIRSASGKCVVDIRDERLVSSKTGENFFATVTVTIEGKMYKGGANYLFDDHIEHNWSLVKTEDKVIDVTEFPKPPTLLIKDQKISGFSGCNRYGGTAIIASNVLFVDKMFSTRMACANMAPEEKYMKLLERVKSYEVVKNRLVLKDENNKIVLEYQAQK
jgi:heat shock protein HslJ